MIIARMCEMFYCLVKRVVSNEDKSLAQVHISPLRMGFEPSTSCSCVRISSSAWCYVKLISPLFFAKGMLRVQKRITYVG